LQGVFDGQQKPTRRKMVKTITGRVQSIKTDFTNMSIVVIVGDISGQYDSVVFYSPKDMTEQQLSEFKRAQNGNLGVRLEFNEYRTINSMAIYCADKASCLEESAAQKNPLLIDEKTGNVGIGTDSIKEDQRLHVQGNLYVDGDLTLTGNASKGKGGSTWGTLGSDKRLKEFPDDIEEARIGNALKVLLQLNGVKYKWKQEAQEKYPTKFDDKEHVGFIAQHIEVLDEDIFSGWAKPDAGHYEINSEEFDALGVYPDHVAFEALTVESIRELDTRLRAAEESIKEMIKAANASLGAIGSALADIKLKQLQHEDRIRQHEDRIRKIEQKLGGN
jgi:hypothetical protein